MGNCYSADDIAEDHIHTDITCNIEEPQQKYRLGTVRNRLPEGGGLKHVLLDPNLKLRRMAHVSLFECNLFLLHCSWCCVLWRP